MSAKREVLEVTLRLIVTVQYDLYGTDPKDLEELLGGWATRMAEEGMMTGSTDAEVFDWDSYVEWISAKVADE